jgi:hypothetical protein
VCDLDVMVAPSKINVIRKAAGLVRARPTLLLISENKLLKKTFFLYFLKKCQATQKKINHNQDREGGDGVKPKPPIACGI